MVKCPFCGFANEEGALFCEQCKSDISSVPAAPMAPPSPPTPMPDSLHHAEAAPMAMPDAPVMAAIIEEHAEVIPLVAVEEIQPVPMVEAAPPATPPEEMPVPPPPPMMPAGESAPPVLAKPVGPAPTPIPAGAAPKLVVQRGLKIGEEYNVFPGENYIGRADEKPVDVDLTFQEPEDRVWTSRQHALMQWDDASGTLTIEDLNSSNGTFVNRERVYPGQPRQLYAGNTIQIGTVHMKVKV